ncbi:DUF2075 domain-containing protein [Candidatus Lucifugimonas marina]|uniref:nuclease-related domain-containing DEAD/DEAH box helicase n=1 Tax=Candidatus Lucifugimonas marina TaxID=3038979 RepID=UPI0027A5D1E6|nr:DUF2075 domain-containing protein [SAR202 cluster bacterium JH545]
MATMYPDVLPDSIVSDPRRRAEVDVYRTLANSLPARCDVLYSVGWLSLDGVSDGEADFVVLDPDRGLLVIEVKGGIKVWRDGGGQWWSESHGHHVNDIKDPVRQAMSSKHQLVRKLKTLPGLRDQWIPAAHAVILPAVSDSGQDMGPDAPRSIFAFAPDMGDLGNKIFEIWDYQGSGKSLGQKNADTARKFLAPSFELSPKWGQMLGAAEQEIVRLTETQFNVFEAIGRNRRIAVYGGAGTGKTLLAIEKARRSAAQGLRTLFTCFNRPLRDELARKIGESEFLEILTFHQVCAQYAKESGLNEKLGGNYDEYPKILNEALGIIGPKYDVVIVDEAQDFYQQGNNATVDGATDWIAVLELCLDGPGIFNVFLDSNQLVYGGEIVLPDETTVWELTENLRNSRQIHGLARRMYSGSIFGTAGPTGPEPVLVQFDDGDFDMLLDRLVQELSRIEQTVDVDQTVVLVSNRSLLNRILESKVGGRFTSTPEVSHSRLVKMDTIARFKGLESSAVLLIGMGDFAESLEAAYVGVTRARTVLTIIGQRSDIEFIRTAK